MVAAEFQIANPIETNQATPMRWVISHLLNHKFLIVTMLIGAFGNAALAAIIPVYVGQAFDIVGSGDMRAIGFLALWTIISQLVRAVLQFGRNFSAATLGERLERDARSELYVSLLGKSMTFHLLQPVGDTMARATNDVREMNLMIATGANLVIGSANFILMPLLLSPTYHPQLILSPIIYTVAYFLALWRYMQTLNPIADDVRVSFGRMNSRLAEAIDGIETVKGASQEAQEVTLFRKNAGAVRDHNVEQGRVEARYLPLLIYATIVALSFTHALLLYRNPAIEFSTGDIVAYVGLILLYGFPTFISLFAYAQVARGLAGARRILELLKTETDLDQNKSGHQGAIEGNIRFNNVHAGYVEGVNVLNNISFDVQPGQTVAIVGQTGAGKSSLVKLLNRTYDVNEGQVTIDGIDVRDWNLASLRQQISIIEQDIFLFSRTIAENIAFGMPNATQAQVKEAADAAQAHDFIQTFPEGYSTVIGERGVTLSGGQRQRLALARAFLTNPRILVLDDSTSAVDSATEDKIQKAIAKAASRQTTFLITHRLSQIRWADIVVLMRNGELLAVGDHDSLMAEHAAYRRIFEQYTS